MTNEWAALVAATSPSPAALFLTSVVHFATFTYIVTHWMHVSAHCDMWCIPSATCTSMLCTVSMSLHTAGMKLCVDSLRAHMYETFLYDLCVAQSEGLVRVVTKDSACHVYVSRGLTKNLGRHAAQCASIG